MSEPVQLHVKRRRTEDAPDVLVLEGTGKDASQVRYVKKQKTQEKRDGEETTQIDPPSLPTRPILCAVPSQQRKPSRRVFHLQAVPSVTGKRKGTEDRVATFVEHKKSRLDGDGVGSHGQDANGDTAAKQMAALPDIDDGKQEAHSPTETYKRPGKGSSMSKPRVPAVASSGTHEDQKKVQELADYMHQAALEEAERESRPKSVAAPKLSADRARELHQRRMASNGALEAVKDHDTESDDDYEFDTYVLAPASGDAMEVDGDAALTNVGYLVISEQDQELWETYLDDGVDGKEWQSDDEDENAEDYYGADYPKTR